MSVHRSNTVPVSLSSGDRESRRTSGSLGQEEGREDKGQLRPGKREDHLTSGQRPVFMTIDDCAIVVQ